VNLLIRRCFEPDSIAFMKPAAVVAGVFDFDGKEGGTDGEGEGEEGEGEDEDEDGDDDVNVLITTLLVPIHLRKSMQVLRTYLQKPKLSTYTNRCGVIYLS
jgi:hypothetical protein